MTKNRITPDTSDLIERQLQQQGIELYAWEYKKEAQGRIIRFFIDSERGVDTDTCALASRTIKDLIDDHPEIDYDYLEVSSPGLDRIINLDRDITRFQGQRIMVKTRQPVEGLKKHVGILTALDKDRLYMEIEGNKIAIERVTISQARLHPEI